MSTSTTERSESDALRNSERQHWTRSAIRKPLPSIASGISTHYSASVLLSYTAASMAPKDTDNTQRLSDSCDVISDIHCEFWIGSCMLLAYFRWPR